MTRFPRKCPSGNNKESQSSPTLFPSTIPSYHVLQLHKDPINMDQTNYASPALYPSLSPTGTETTFQDSPTALVKPENGSIGEPRKKKQKRNKPTLSCIECVERKTKVSETFH